jgi:hypothetical protein
VTATVFVALVEGYPLTPSHRVSHSS